MEKSTFYRVDDDKFCFNYDEDIRIIKTQRFKAWKNEFTTPEEARKHFNMALKIATKEYKLFYNKYRELITTCGCSISYIMNGDTHGIYEDYMYVGFTVNGYYIKFALNGI